MSSGKIVADKFMRTRNQRIASRPWWALSPVHLQQLAAEVIE